MTDYSQLSDFEINKSVADIVMNGTWHATPSHPDNKTGGWLYGSNGIQTYPLPDYCNNPADAWPIIHDNLISINFDNDGYDTPQSSWCRAAALTGDEYYGDEKKPLRAAMIAFLMMQGSSNANPI